ncbi:MAG: phosphotransferase [Chloroflexota bacterium]|nr:MAG: phosphotransferase family protein [Chloroflexota bacterium]
MTTSDELTIFAKLVQRIIPGARLLRVWRLEGGVSAQVTAIECILSGGQTRKLIVRRHGAADLQRNPRVAQDEFRLLDRLYHAGLPVPKPYYVDESGEFFPTPCLVVEFIEGRPDFAPADLNEYLQQQATLLASIHGADIPVDDLSFLPEQNAMVAANLRRRPEHLDDSLDEGLIRDALETAWPLRQANRTLLLHGDFWPGNLLWRDGRLAGVIDWEDAALGDPLADMGISRLEILWAFGMEAMERFTNAYRALMPSVDFGNLPYWDLWAALRPAFQIAGWAGSEERERIMRERHKLFVAQAFEKLPGS